MSVLTMQCYSLTPLWPAVKASLSSTSVFLVASFRVSYLSSCQCGISRSATLVIALVMRAAAQQSPSVPPDVWALKGMQGAYSYVKQKSKWVGPNMSYASPTFHPVISLTPHAKPHLPTDGLREKAQARHRRLSFSLGKVQLDRRGRGVGQAAQVVG